MSIYRIPTPTGVNDQTISGTLTTGDVTINGNLTIDGYAYNPSSWTINTIADLRASSAYFTNSVVQVLGYYSVGDLGGGLFYWSSTSVATDNGGSVIKPTAISGAGRWIRPLNTEVSALWFGAIADNTTDLGAPLNAIFAALGSAGGNVFVPGGDYAITTPIHITQNIKLTLGNGTYSPNIGVSPYIPFELDGYTELTGSGWGTIIRENSSTLAGGFSWGVIQSYTNILNNDADGESNINISNLQIQGPYANGYSSSAASVGMGNCHNVVIDHVYLNYTKGIGVQFGASSNDGYHASNCWMTECLFEHVASQNCAPVNCEDYHIFSNTFRDGGQTGAGTNSSYLDAEENRFTDRNGPSEICNNIFDSTNAQSSGNAILIQGSGAVPASWPQQTGPVIILGNVIMGGRSDADSGAGFMSSGIFLTNAYGITVASNEIYRCYQAAVSLNGCVHCTITGNGINNCGGGGIPAIAVNGTTYSKITDNQIHIDASSGAGPSDCRIVETGASDYNMYSGNNSEANIAPASGALIVMVGANSAADNNMLVRLSTHQTGSYLSTATINSSRSLALADRVLFVDTTSGDVTLTLSDAINGAFDTQVGVTGREVSVKRIDGYHNIILSPILGQKIDGYSSLIIDDDQMVTIQSDGSNWWSNRYILPVIVATKTSAYTAFPNELVQCNPTGGGFTITLPAAVGHAGQQIIVKNITPSTNPITIAPDGYDTIDSAFIYTITDGYGSVIMYSDGVSNWMTQNNKTSSNVTEMLITTTSATNVINLTNVQAGNYNIRVYYRVVTASTNITIAATWTDTSGSQSSTLANVTPQLVGSYSVSPLFINVVALSTITITVTAGTANQIYVSANAELL